MKNDKPQLQSQNPLWMPQGSVRSLISFILLAVTSYMLIKGVEIPEWYSVLVVSSISFYFGTRKATIKPE